MTAENQYLVALGEVFAERGLPGERMLEAIMVGGTAQAYLGFAALTDRVELMLPVHSAVLSALLPGSKLPSSLPAKGVIRAAVDRDRISAGVVTIGAVAPHDAAQHAVIDPLVAAGGKVMNCVEDVSARSTKFAISFSPRTGDAEERFTAELTRHVSRIGLPDDRAALWTKLYQVSGIGRTLSVTTEFAGGRATSHFAVLNDNNTFDQAIDLLKIVASAAGATYGATMWGAVAGKLGVSKLMGVELMLSGGEAPDVVAWLPPNR